MTATRTRSRPRLISLTKRTGIRSAIVLFFIAAVGFACWWFRDRLGLEADGGARRPVVRAEDGEPRVGNPQGPILLDAEQQRAIGLKTVKASLGHAGRAIRRRAGSPRTRPSTPTSRPRAAGVVRSVTAHIGQDVKAGDLLATIDSPEVGEARLDLYTRLQALDIARAQADWQETIYRNTLELSSARKRARRPSRSTTPSPTGPSARTASGS